MHAMREWQPRALDLGALDDRVMGPGNLMSRPGVYLDVSTKRSRNKLRTLDSYLQQEEWGEAVELLQNLVEGSSNKLIPIGADAPSTYVDLRTFSQYRISRLPPVALQVYRERVEGQAADLFQRFEETGNPEHLEQIADQFFSSSVAPKAIERLAELSVTRGTHGEAIAWWKKILPADFRPPLRPGEIRLEHPDPKLDMPRVVAKYCLTLVLAGEMAKADAALERLRAAYPNAAGKLAGRDGLYWEIVAAIGRDAKVTQAAAEDGNWTTFAGNSARTKIAPTTIDVGDVQWKWTIDEEPDSQPDPRLPADARGGLEDTLAYHPAVVGNKAFLVTERFLSTFDLETGKMERWYDFQGDHPLNRGNLDPRVRYTLTIDGDRLLVRTGGSTGMNQRMAPRRAPGNSALYCFDHRRQRLLWTKNSSSVSDNGDATFEGAPLIQGDNVYIAATRVDAMSQTSVVCFDAASGKVKWRTLVCEATNDLGSYVVSTNNLLTLADNTIFYGTNLGAVAALNAQTGRLRWVSVYPRSKPITTRAMTSLAPDLNPCVHHQGKLFLAASDTAKIQCFDAETGRKLWDAHPPVAHLLGVAKGNLIVTGNRVWGIDVETGKIRWYWPENTVASHGRGTLAGDFVYWPTKERIHVLEQATGKAARTPIELFDRLRLKAGNIVISGDHMLLAQSNRLLALVPYTRLIEKLKQELVANPQSGELNMRLAEAALAINDFALAKNQLAAAAKLAKPEEIYEGRPLAVFANDQLFGVTLREAQTFAEKADLVRAQTLYDEAVRLAPTPAQRWESHANQARMWVAAGRPDQAVRPCQAVLDDDNLRDVLISPDNDHRQIPARQWAEETISGLIAKHGIEIYDAEQATLHAAMLRTTSGDEWLRLAIRHPNSTQVGDMLLSAARDFETRGRWRDARLAYKRIDRTERIADPLRLEALFGLDRAYAASGLDQPRRLLLERLQRTFGEQQAPGRPPGEKVLDFVSRELVALDKASPAVPQREPRALHRGERHLKSEGRLGLAVGTPPSPDLPPMLLVATKGQLTAETPREEKPLWRVECQESPSWYAYSSTGLVVATSRGIQGLSYESGSVLWECPLSEAREDLSWSGVDRKSTVSVPTHSRPPEPEPDASPPWESSRFALAGEVLLAVSEEGKLIALDVDTGDQLWRVSEEEPLLPAVQLEGSLAVIWTENHLVGIDAWTGQRRFRVPIRNGTAGQPVVGGEGRIFAVVDRATIQAIDLSGENQGKVAWSREFIWPSFQLPRLFSNGKEVLVSIDGYQLARVDPSSGEVVWHLAVGSRPQMVLASSKQGPASPYFKHSSAVLHDDALVYVHDDWLECREVKDGSLRYRRALPAGMSPWTMFAFGPLVVAIGSASEGARVTIWDGKSGRLSQGLHFPDLHSPLGFQWSSDFAIVGDEKTSWVLKMESASRTPSKGEAND
ncbi:MAG: PQQ-binding-like beta-propeller repeat protein [Planctomycetota bacterium]